ncbi:MAG TPA: YdcF family protein [Stellaceae bacterium]|nr:YdcF family protein [Stellaceae bacterium]
MTERTRRRLAALGWFAAGAGTTLLLWLVGLAWFVHGSLSMSAEPNVTTDAIVVLTGGRLRLEAGLDLLRAGRAQKLFVSGVNPRVDRGELLRVAGRAEGDASRIVIGHDADNTLGNARETALWMQQEGYRSLRLVTSWYHMQRSLVEFERAMPDVTIVPEPVFATHSEDWAELATLAVSEYDKYLATVMRPAIAAIWPHAGEWGMRESGPVAAAAGAAAGHRP